MHCVCSIAEGIFPASILAMSRRHVIPCSIFLTGFAHGMTVVSRKIQLIQLYAKIVDDSKMTKSVFAPGSIILQIPQGLLCCCPEYLTTYISRYSLPKCHQCAIFLSIYRCGWSRVRVEISSDIRSLPVHPPGNLTSSRQHLELAARAHLLPSPNKTTSSQSNMANG